MAKKTNRKQEPTEVDKAVLKRKRRRKRRLIFVLVLLSLIGICVYLGFTSKLTDIEVTGNTQYSDEQMISMIFREEDDYNTVYSIYRNKFKKHETIPFVEKYTLTVTGLHSATLMVYEKSLAGCMEITGGYAYFDRDGIVVEISDEKVEEIPLVTGLKAKSAELYETLEVGDDSVFNEILNITQLLDKYELTPEEVEFTEEHGVALHYKELIVILGANRYLAGKIGEFCDMLPQIENLKGTLHLENYDPSIESPAYSFEQ